MDQSLGRGRGELFFSLGEYFSKGRTGEQADRTAGGRLLILYYLLVTLDSVSTANRNVPMFPLF